MKENNPPAFIGKLPARNRPSYAFQRILVRYILLFVLFFAAGILLGSAVNERFRAIFTSVLIKYSLSAVTQSPAELSKRLSEAFRLSIPGLAASAALFASGFLPMTGLINSTVTAISGFLEGFFAVIVFIGSKNHAIPVSKTLALVLVMLISISISVYFIRVASDSEVFGEKAKKCIRCGEKLIFRDFMLRYILSFLLSVGIVWLAGLGIYFIIFLVL